MRHFKPSPARHVRNAHKSWFVLDRVASLHVPAGRGRAGAKSRSLNDSSVRGAPDRGWATWRLAAAVVLALAVTACGRTGQELPAPRQLPADQAVAATPAASSVDPSVPAAASVLTPAPAARVDPAAGRSNKAMSPTQESNTMPMPGQNNDHSAPLTPPKGASAP